MPTTSRRLQVINALKALARTIRIANGFNTDAGEHVFVGEAPAFGTDDPESAIVLVVGDEELTWQVPGKAAQIGLPVAFQALARADCESPHETVEQLIADIQTAIEVADGQRLGGLVDWPLEFRPVRALQREPGSTSVGAEVPYLAQFKRGWGHP